MKYHKRKGLWRRALKILLCCVFAAMAVSYILFFKGGDETQGFLSTHIGPQTNKTLF